MTLTISSKRNNARMHRHRLDRLDRRRHARLRWRQQSIRHRIHLEKASLHRHHLLQRRLKSIWLFLVTCLIMFCFVSLIICIVLCAIVDRAHAQGLFSVFCFLLFIFIKLIGMTTPVIVIQPPTSNDANCATPQQQQNDDADVDKLQSDIADRFDDDENSIELYEMCKQLIVYRFEIFS